MNLKLCCQAWFSWRFVKKDKDRAPVIQSCVYTEIHTILTLTSLWRWQRHALILNFLCSFEESMLFPILVYLFLLFCYQDINSHLFANLYIKAHFLLSWFHHVWCNVLVGDNCFLIMFWPPGFIPCSFWLRKKKRKVNKAKKKFLPLTFFVTKFHDVL